MVAATALLVVGAALFVETLIGVAPTKPLSVAFPVLLGAVVASLAAMRLVNGNGR